MTQNRETKRNMPESIRIDGKLPTRENTYYRKISERYRNAGFILILLLVVYLGIMLLRFGEYVTYDSFVYLVRDVGSVRGDGASGDIKYSDASDGVFSPFEGGLAVHADGILTIYDSTGVMRTENSEIMSSPAIVSGNGYLILFDIGGTDYSVYNTMSRIIKKSTVGGIVAASVSDNGSFAITSEGTDSRYVTEIYGSALSRVMSIGQDKYVISSVISADGKTVVTASVNENDVCFGYELSFYGVGNESILKTVTEDVVFPTALRATEEGFVLVCDSEILFLSSGGDIVKKVSVSADYFDVSRKTVIAVCGGDGLGQEDTVYVFDARGEEIYNGGFSGKITGVSASENTEVGLGYVTDGERVTKLGDNSESGTVDVGRRILRITDTEKVYSRAVRTAR